jgi:hypothetical protein
MIANVVASILFVSVCLALIVAILHIGGVRNSSTLSSMDDRHPWLSLLFGTLPMNKLDRLGVPNPPDALHRFFWVLSLLGAIGIVTGLVFFFLDSY